MLRSLGLMLLVLTAAPSWAAKPVYKSPTVSAATPGHAVTIDVELESPKRLYLAVSDAGNGYGCDWANWAEPRLVHADGKVTKLTELRWNSATAGWGKVAVGKNAGGGPLKIAGADVEHGIGVHANSLIEFDLPPGVKRFQARGGLDDGGTSQGCGSSVQFLVFTEKPDGQFVAATAPAGGADSGVRDAEHALDGLDVHEDLQAEVFAAEPHFSNPTNVDVDHLGRVWVCEVLNYRAFRNKKDRKEGDRILVLQDVDGDGVADAEATKVFHQGRDVDSAHGICVLPTPTGKGTKALISCGDKVFYLIDDDGDLKADRKEILFTGISGTQHDHGIHAFVFGPDGKLYFNVGNAGKQIKDKDGKPIVDLAGNIVNDSRKPYQEGMVFRCNLDGSEFETLGWNFRNNWEVCVDSFGTMWQSDNDDDGNRGVRINYVMEFGNYGYKDELTGAGWRSPRTGMHDEVPKRHWHLNDPGVVPNLLQTGAGSPTGICVYEGDLLPKVFQNQIIHCDAGPNVVRAYPVEPDGAGYKATIENILAGTRDKWFRPSDVCVAPDGSLLVADWYDPGVGGHAMGDVDRGRLFRVTPKGHEGYRVPKTDVSTPEGAVEALKSPNLATRYLGWTALRAMGENAKSSLLSMWKSDNPRWRARALWLLVKIDGEGSNTFGRAVEDGDSDIRVTALRAARQAGGGLGEATVISLADDPHPAVRRECLIALRHADAAAILPPGAPKEGVDAVKRELESAFGRLVSKYDGKDRWYLEAVGIAADGRWNECLNVALPELRKRGGEAAADVVLRSRASVTPFLLAEMIKDPENTTEQRARMFRAMDFQENTPDKNVALVHLVTSNHPTAQADITALALKHGAKVDLKDPAVKKAIDDSLEQVAGTMAFVNLVDTLNVVDRYPDLLAIAQRHPGEQLGVRAANVLLDGDQRQLVTSALAGDDPVLVAKTFEALGNSGNGKIVSYTSPVVSDPEAPLANRRAALAAMVKARNGALEIVKTAKAGKLDDGLKQVAASSLHSAQWRDVRAEAMKLFPPPPSKNSKPLPPLEQLVASKGDWKRGRLLFNSEATCAKCHQVNGQGKEVGPELTEIGSKLSRQAMFQSILYPSAGISHNYETYSVITVDGNQLNGILASRTDDSITIKGADAIPRTIKTADVEEITKQPISLMPADLQKTMTAQDLVDVVEYLQTLKKKTTASTK